MQNLGFDFSFTKLKNNDRKKYKILKVGSKIITFLCCCIANSIKNNGIKDTESSDIQGLF